MSDWYLEKICQAWMQGDDIIPRKPFRQVAAEYYHCELEEADRRIQFLREKGYPVDVASDR